MRHYLNLRIIVSMFTEYAIIGPFELNWETQQYKSWLSQYITFALLAALQAINLFWLFLILRIGYRYAFQNAVVKDDRSEDEGTEEEAEREKRKVRRVEANGSAVATGMETRSKANGRMREERASGKMNGRANGRANGHVIKSDARRKEGESYADAVKDGNER